MKKMKVRNTIKKSCSTVRIDIKNKIHQRTNTTRKDENSINVIESKPYFILNKSSRKLKARIMIHRNINQENKPFLSLKNKRARINLKKTIKNQLKQKRLRAHVLIKNKHVRSMKTPLVEIRILKKKVLNKSQKSQNSRTSNVLQPKDPLISKEANRNNQMDSLALQNEKFDRSETIDLIKNNDNQNDFTLVSDQKKIFTCSMMDDFFDTSDIFFDDQGMFDILHESMNFIDEVGTETIKQNHFLRSLFDLTGI